MKELSVEEKAKRYDEALEAIKSLQEVNPSDEGIQNWVNENFPELKESEDERIRKELICFLKTEIPHCNARDKYIAWLEKKGEQNPYSGVLFKYNGHTWGMCARDNGVEILMDGNLKAFISLDKSFIYPVNPTPLLKTENFYVSKVDGLLHNITDKVEPKFNFKVGQWIVATGECIYLITKIDGFNVTLVDTNGDEYVFDASSLNDAHEWTIQDANDGDVLACNEEILLFKSYSVQGRISLYCWYNGQTNNFHSKEVVDTLMTTRNKICPATKEQRDTLIKAMTDAGYTFDFKNKELNKIEQKPIDKPKFKVKYAGSEYNVFETKDIAGAPFYGIEDEPNHIDYVKADNCEIINDGMKEGNFSIPTKPVMFSKQKPNWSEEDEKEVAVLEAYIHSKDWSDRHIDRALGIIDELVNKVKSLRPQPKQEWSEEDENRINRLIAYFEDKESFNAEDDIVYANWLKSLRPQKQWKPSKEQMEALWNVYEGGEKQSALASLYNDLKKL